MSTRTPNETESLVQGLLSDAASGAHATIDLLREQAARASQAERNILLGLLRAHEVRMEPTGPCGFFDPPFKTR
jgi:hypothetical protein